MSGGVRSSGVDTWLVGSLFLGWVAFAIVPLNVVLQVALGHFPHARALGMVLAAMQCVCAFAAAIGMVVKTNRLRGAPRRTGAILLVLGYALLGFAGLVGLGLIYVASLDTAGVGARFN